MASVDNPKPVLIEGFPLDEKAVSLGDLTKFTHGNFHNAIDVIRNFNTPEGILGLFIDEVDELIEAIEQDPENRVSVVAELGDLFHFWGDLFQLTDASVATLINSLNLDGLNVDDLTIAQARNAAVIDQERQLESGQLNARDMLYELKELLRLSEGDEVDVEIMGVIASHIFAVAEALDVNVIYAVLMKNLRNRQKYDPEQMNLMHEAGGDYSFIRGEMVERWLNGLGGDAKFFEEFLASFPMELSYVVAGQLATD